jgi:hypothetical protein
LKESLKKIIFSSNISKIPEFILNIEMEHRKKERKKKHRKKEKGRKAPEVSLSLLKKGNSIFWEEKTFSKFFHVRSFSPPPFYHLKNRFPNHFKILGSFGTIP